MEETLKIEFHQRRLLVKALNKTNTIDEASALLGVCTRTVMRWKKKLGHRILSRASNLSTKTKGDNFIKPFRFFLNAIAHLFLFNLLIGCSDKTASTSAADQFPPLDSIYVVSGPKYVYNKHFDTWAVRTTSRYEGRKRIDYYFGRPQFHFDELEDSSSVDIHQVFVFKSKKDAEAAWNKFSEARRFNDSIKNFKWDYK